METSSDAFEAIFRAHHDDLYRFAVRRVGPDSAADVVAEVFLIAWRRRAEIPADAVRLWLFGVASNRVLKEYRGSVRRARLSSRLAAEPSVTTVDSSDQVDENAVLHRALANLPETDQEALRLTQWDQLSPSEAAAVIGCSAATFRVRLHRARRRLAAALEAESTPIPRPLITQQDVTS